MKNRREFLKDAAAGAVVIGAQSKLGLAAAAAGKSKVVVARDAALHDASGQLNERRVQALLDRAIATYTGRDRAVEAWRRIVPVGKVIGLKVNGLGGKGISTHAALVMAVCERLQQAGVKAGRDHRLGSRRARSAGLRPDHLHRSQPHSRLRQRCGRL